MTKLFWILGIVVVIWGGWQLFEMWDKYDTEKDVKAKQAEEAAHFSPNELSGMPRFGSETKIDFEATYAMAQKNGASGIKKWMNVYGSKVRDPRRAWIELDYVVAVATEDPSEARKVYAEVKSREIKDEHVKKRIKELAGTYENSSK